MAGLVALVVGLIAVGARSYPAWPRQTHEFMRYFAASQNSPGVSGRISFWERIVYSLILTAGPTPELPSVQRGRRRVTTS